MKVLIIEDEYHAQKRITNLIKELRPAVEILAVLDSVEDGVEWLHNNPSPDLMFFDIQLSDGLSFEIFPKVAVKAPVIFTTAFDEYAIQAFKINSVDYLLKPVEEDDLERAFKKFEEHFQQKSNYDISSIEQLVQRLTRKDYPSRFLIKSGQQISYLPTAEIAYFYSEDSLTFARTMSGKKYIIDHKIDDLQNLVNPNDFFRINRKVILRIDAIQKVSPYFSGRLILELQPKSAFEVTVSRERVKGFKNWMGA